jgi:hypothetical protein
VILAVALSCSTRSIGAGLFGFVDQGRVGERVSLHFLIHCPGVDLEQRIVLRARTGQG